MTEIDKNIQCGFIGLGSQGGPMARRIAEAGFPLTLWARRADTLAPFDDTGAHVASSVAELGARCDHVGVCVVDDAGTREVCDALVATMAPGSRLVIHSTVHPSTCRDIAARAASSGVKVIDAPVSGGGRAAAAGTLTVMVGGDATALAAARPALESFAGLIVHLGDVGAGQTAKLVNNSLMAANLAMAHAALDTGEALGIDRAALGELVKASSGHSFAMDICAMLPRPGAFAQGASLLTKDTDLLATLPGAYAAAAPLLAAALPLLALVRADASVMASL